jgi:hypothetical protein
VAQANLKYAKDWIADGVAPQLALENSFQDSANEGERSVRYWCLPTERLDALKFPAVLMNPVRLNIAISVIRQAKSRAPRYFVLLVTSSYDEQQFKDGQLQ